MHGFFEREPAPKHSMEFSIEFRGGQQKLAGPMRQSLPARAAQTEKETLEHSRLRNSCPAGLFAPFELLLRTNGGRRQRLRRKNMQGSSAPIPAFVAARSQLAQKGIPQTDGRVIRLRHIEEQDVVTSGSERISARK